MNKNTVRACAKSPLKYVLADRTQQNLKGQEIAHKSVTSEQQKSNIRLLLWMSDKADQTPSRSLRQYT